MTVQTLSTERSKAPAEFTRFVQEMQRFVASKGLAWDISSDKSGNPLKGQNWDLRRLTNSHSGHATRLPSMSVDKTARDLALADGWSPALLPATGVFSSDVQDFIKALAAFRCAKGFSDAATAVNLPKVRRFFSLTAKAPWELCAEDLERAKPLISGSNVAQAMSWIVKLLNEFMLSRHVPIVFDAGVNAEMETRMPLNERSRVERLPERDAFYELIRIVFQEVPLNHHDLLRFGAVRLMMLTGLRLNEVMMLPVDCLRWEMHLDTVTGKNAAEVGGVGRSLGVRYFAEKNAAGGPNVLVPALHRVPRLFEVHVAEAVALVQRHTEALRAVLQTQHQAPSASCNSDLRTFRTTEGQTLTSADLLFLVVFRTPVLQERSVHTGAKIGVLAGTTLSSWLRASPAKRWGVFSKYGKTEESRQFHTKSHSFRHLLTTELFRLNVPDTVITHQFGRQSVSQSYEYDHRTLAERLRFVQLPDAAQTSIKPGSSQELVAKMVVSGVAAKSHLGQSFKRIQAEHGDGAAFEYLAANSDGFHVTPYGFCTNSFSLNPCARHLKCFDNCRHFVASGQSEHKVMLSDLRGKLVQMRDAAKAKPMNTTGRKNQISHADALLWGVDKALAAEPDQPVFPEGLDHSAPPKDVFK